MGTRLEIGDVLLEITQYTRPCHKQKDNFKPGQYMAINQLKHPGRSRVYGAVLKRGNIKTGDRVTCHVDTQGAKAYTRNADVIDEMARAATSKQQGSSAASAALIAVSCMAIGILLGRLSVKW